MLRIDRLTLRLPARYGTAADAIARGVGQALGDMPLSASGTVRHLEVPPIRIAPAATHEQVARAVASRISERIGNGR